VGKNHVPRWAITNSGPVPSGITIPKQLYMKGGSATYDAITKKLIHDPYGYEVFLD
jgi:hypothetical protein